MQNARFLAFGPDRFVTARVRGASRESAYTFTSVRTWDGDAQPERVWGHPMEYPLGVAALFACDLFESAYAVLFETGEIDLRGDGKPLRIVDAIRSTARHRRGYLLNGRQVGNEVIVTGNGGQTYISKNGDDWQPFITGLFNPPRGPLPDLLNEPVADILKKLEGDEDIALRNIIEGIEGYYLCGGNGNLERKILHWDGVTVRSLLPPRSEQIDRYILNDIVQDASTGDVWSCGLRGALMRGNVEEGFAQVDGVDAGRDGDVPFYRLALWRDAVWLAGGEALYRYRDGVLSEVPTPEMGRGLHTVQATDDVLWVCSLDAIARFDGRDWMVVTGPSD